MKWDINLKRDSPFRIIAFLLIPSSMWTAVNDLYGVLGILPSAITDGGTIILSSVMIVSMFKYRTT